jgi:hypothetical protein
MGAMKDLHVALDEATQARHKRDIKTVRDCRAGLITARQFWAGLTDSERKFMNDRGVLLRAFLK